MKNDYNQKVMHICEKSREYISLKIRAIEDTAATFSKDSKLKSAIYTYNTNVLKTIAELKTINEDIESAFVVSDNQSYFYVPNEQLEFSDLIRNNDKSDEFGEGQWIIHSDKILYVCKIYDDEKEVGILGFKLNDDLFLPFFENYADYFLHDVKVIVSNGVSQYAFFSEENDIDLKKYINIEEDKTVKVNGNIVYKTSYDNDLSIIMVTSCNHINYILLKLVFLLTIVFIFACVLLYLLLKWYLGFVTSNLERLNLKIQNFSDFNKRGNKND